MSNYIWSYFASPSDGAVEVPSNGIVLSWEYGQYVQEYQLFFGTDYPPTEMLMDWTAIDPMGDNYALPNLDPSMQYFWQVNVRNNNATVTSCDVYGFTTTITPPSNLTATVIENAEDDYDVQLIWSASAKALLGYNVYRSDDGATYNMLNTSAVTTNSYLDENLTYNMSPCYTYYVEAIFDEGVSDPSNEASACITGVGTLNGTITELLTGDPIIGATISVSSQTSGSTYELTSSLTGEYTVDVLEDCYNLTVSANGFVTEMREDVCVDYNTNKTEDFQLDEFPYPVTYVTATETSENTVQVDWGGATGELITDWIYYDNGTYETSIGGVPTAMMWAIKFDPDQMEGYGGCALTKFQVYISASATMDFIVMQGDNAENVIYQETIDALTWNPFEWNEIELSMPVEFNHQEPLWFGFFTDTPFSYFAAAGPGQDEPNGDLISQDGVLWEHIGDLGFDLTWNLRGFVTNQSGKSMEVGKDYLAKNRILFEEGANADYKANNSGRNPETASIHGTINPASKGLFGYNVYRQVCNESTPMEFLGMTLDEEFTDNTWGSVDWGTYKWAVEAIYTNSFSEVVYSNCLDKDMEATVGVEVTTNSGDAPEGCQVVFTNTSEPDLELVYDIDLDATGLATIEPFRKGVYDIVVGLPGFFDIEVSDVLVDSDTVFVWQIEELVAQPANLYVTPTGFATWELGGEIAFQPLFEDFEVGNIPEGWTATANDEPGWFVTLNGSSGWFIPPGDGYYACANDDATDDDSSMDYLITPVLNFSSADEPMLTFDSYFTAQYDQRAYIEVSVDGGSWVVVKEYYGQSGWNTEIVDLIDYAGLNNVRIAFHSSDAGVWGSGWAVDNVAVTDGSGKKSNKGFQFYKIWHDGMFSNDVDTTFYQYGTNTDVDVLVPGETYLAEVATLYSTGLSDKTNYEWTYIPCDSFPSWELFDAYNIEGSSNNVVNWTPDALPTPTFTPITEDFESGYLPEGWSKTSNSYLGWFFTPDGSSWTFWIPWNDNGIYACTNDDLAGDDGSVDYLITPEMSFVGVPGIQLSFSSYFTGDLGQLASVEVSTDGGSSWTVVENMTPTTTWQWEDVSIDLSDFVGEPNVLIGFHSNDNNGFGSGWAIDDVNIDVFEPADGTVEVIGTNIYRDGEMIAFVPVPDTFYLDMNLNSGYYDYCVDRVYSKDEGVHSWTSCEGSACVMDVLIPEDCNAPENLTVEDLLGDGYTATLNWETSGSTIQEFRYDDGTATGQLGSNAGTLNTLLGNIHSVDAELTEMSWYLTSDGGPHNTISIYVLGLDATGIPNGNNVIFTESVSNTDGTWNTYTFDTPLDITGGFFLGVGYNGFAALGTDDGTGDPYTFVPNTHYFVADYTSGGWDTWETFGFNVNGMIRALGIPGSVASYPVSDLNTTPNSDLTYAANETAIVTEEPKWTTSGLSTKEFMHFNVYRDGELIADDITETTYADEVGVAGEFCYEVTAVYSVCGESDPTNEACVYVAVGIDNLENNISVYPNPANDFVMIESIQDIRSIEITNSMGQLVNSVKAVEMSQYRINTSSLSAGIYFIQIETANRIEKVRIVISE